MKLPEITPEQTIDIANKMIQHVLKQGFKCVGEGGYCLYRGVDGASCAVGSQIKDEFYTHYIEDTGINERGGANNSLALSISASLNNYSVNLFTGIQEAHDNANSGDFNQSFINSLPNDDGLIKELIGESDG